MDCCLRRVLHCIFPSPIYPNDRAPVQKVHTAVSAEKKKEKKEHHPSLLQWASAETGIA